MKHLKKFFVTKIAEKILTRIPKPKVRANPFTKLVPNPNRIRATINVVTLLSLIDGQARENPSSITLSKLFCSFLSSLIREKIKTLASIAIPIDNIKPAIPARVKVTDYFKQSQYQDYINHQRNGSQKPR